MHTLIAAALLFVIPLASVAAPGGKACQVADSAVPTPGLNELVFGAKTDPVPAGANLTEGQIDRLAELDTNIRRILKDVEVRRAKLPQGKPAEPSAELARQELPALVEQFLTEQASSRALLIDVESAQDFRLANAEALAAKAKGDDARWCDLCLAVRRGIEADFRWKSDEFGALTPEQKKEAADLASIRNDVRRKWAATLQSELNPVQLTWLRQAQMRWLKATLHSSVASGMRTLGAKKCDACATEGKLKCQFCAIVLAAVEEAKSKS